MTDVDEMDEDAYVEWLENHQRRAYARIRALEAELAGALQGEKQAWSECGWQKGRAEKAEARVREVTEQRDKSLIRTHELTLAVEYIAEYLVEGDVERAREMADKELAKLREAGP